MENPSGCAPDRRLPGYRLCSYVVGWHTYGGRDYPQVATTASRSDRLHRYALRWGIGRGTFQVTPGIYAVGNPTSADPVFVSANYRMSFDILRSSLHGFDGWILVIDTKGVNVWCAAGKGSFGTEEIVKRVKATGLAELVGHRRLILPQLGAVGVAAHEVTKGCGFSVTYGPVRAVDIPAFLKAGMQATPEMRRITFTAMERFILTPVELVVIWRHLAWFAGGIFLFSFIGSHFFSLGESFARWGSVMLLTLLGLISGSVLTPVLLPLLPGRMFAVKGAATGGAIGILSFLWLINHLSIPSVLAAVLLVTSVSSYGAMNFTGSSTFTSPSGVEKEMKRAIPAQFLGMLIAGALWLYAAF